jgi:cyclopropane fatty-acyl-phospholipid synthase-like methyltransferase
MSTARVKQSSDIQLYETFHNETTFSTRIVKESDFAMYHILNTFKKYISKDHTILDIGCGGGSLSLYMADKGAHVTGIDISKKSITENEKAREFFKFKNLTYKNIRLEDYDAKAGTLDRITMTEVLEHVPDEASALKKIYSLLSKDGYFLGSVPSKNAPLHKQVMKKYGKDEFDIRVGHLRRYTIEDLQKLFVKHKFEIVEYKLCEGWLHNWIFNDSFGSKFLRFVKGPIKHLVLLIDTYIFLPLFGESDIVFVAKKK